MTKQIKKTVNRYHSILVWLLLILLAGCNQTNQSNADEQLKAKEDAMIELTYTCLDIWKTGNIDLVEEVYSPEIVRRWVGEPDVIGLEAYKNEVKEFNTAFPDIDWKVENMFVKGDKVYYELTMTGTHSGPLGDLPPTGKKVNIKFMEVDRVVDNKIVEEWSYMNQLTFMEQLGFTISPPPVDEEK